MTVTDNRPATTVDAAASLGVRGTGTPAESRGSGPAALLRRIGTTGLSAVVSVVLVCAAWTLFLRLANVNTLVGKGPGDVWTFLVTAPKAAANRSDIGGQLGTTLAHASVGFVAGLLAATIVAVLFVLLSTVEQALMPVAMVVRSVPLVAMTPLLVLIFGRGVLGVTVIVGIVVFFPALVTIVFGLRSAPAQATDLVKAYGGSGWTVLRTVSLPSALPALFTAARISVPGCIIGALLAEWLATGTGLGYQMLKDASTFAYTHLWSSVVVLTVVSVVLYYVVGAVESVVTRRFGVVVRR